MRIVGYACKHPDPPLRKAYVPLADLTVLLGPNDSGKSSLLRALERDLSGGHFAAVDNERAKLIGGVFYVEASKGEIANLSEQGFENRKRSRNYNETRDAARQPWDDGLWNARYADTLEAQEEDLADSLLRALLDTDSDESETREAILGALRESPLLGVEPAGRNHLDERIWNVYWCLPPFDALDEDVQAALSRSSLKAFRARREERLWRTGFYAFEHGRPEHLLAAGAPVAVASFGPVTRLAMPSGLAVPTGFGAVRSAIKDATTSLVNTARHGLDDAQREGEPLDMGERAARVTPRAWIGGDADGYKIHEDARATTAYVMQAANRLLPDFVAGRYQVVVSPRDIQRWFAEEPLDVLLTSKDESVSVEFAVEDAADGFQLWIQLALLNALGEAGLVEASLRETAAGWWSAASDAASAYAADMPEEAEGYETTADELQGRFDALLSALRASTEVTDTPPIPQFDVGPDDDWTRYDAVARRLFLVDEPERHLHPRLQRAAASWLAQTSSAHAAPCILATHSPAFLALPADAATYIHVGRRGDDVVLQPFQPADVDQLDAVSTAMGYDRGELLSTLAVWLVVEGPLDKLVMDALFTDDLRRAGVGVLPLHGIANWKGLLEADALWRYTAAPVAVMFDKVSVATIDEMSQLPSENLEVTVRDGSRTEEARTMARLVRMAREHRKDLHPVPNERSDIFEHLDEDAIKKVFPKYPGHEDAEAAWRRHSKGSRDAFLNRKYSIRKDAASFRRIADVMIEQETEPEGLRAVVEFCGDLGRRAVADPLAG